MHEDGSLVWIDMLERLVGLASFPVVKDSMPGNHKWMRIPKWMEVEEKQEADLCEKVPRSTSCPVSRTNLPSRAREPKASCSAVAQSIFFPVLNMSSLRLMAFSILGWSFIPVGSLVRAAPIWWPRASQDEDQHRLECALQRQRKRLVMGRGTKTKPFG